MHYNFNGQIRSSSRHHTSWILILVEALADRRSPTGTTQHLSLFIMHACEDPLLPMLISMHNNNITRAHSQNPQWRSFEKREKRVDKNLYNVPW